MREQEVKIRIKNKSQLIKKLNGLGYKEKEVIRQKTYRCWRSDKLFSRAGIYPRTRTTIHSDRTEHTFTVKSRFKDPEKGLFEREECEIRVEDAKKVAKALSLLGLSDQRILEKRRHCFRKPGQEATYVLLDEFCFGDYLEIEGSPKAIDNLLEQLKIEGERLGMAYWDVYWHYCKDRGVKEKRNLILEE